ncbi:MAG: hypothetical protein ABJJ03_01220 [Sulfitobacter sp.]
MKEQITSLIKTRWQEFLASSGNAVGQKLTVVSIVLAVLVASMNFLVKQNMMQVPNKADLAEFNFLLMTFAGYIAITGAILGGLGHWLRRRGIYEAEQAINADLESALEIDLIIAKYKNNRSQSALLRRILSRVQDARSDKQAADS